MHSCHWVRHFVVKILIRVTQGVSSIMSEVVHVLIVIVQIHASVKVLRQEVKPHIVDVCRHNLIDGNLLVAPVFGQGKRQVAGLKNGHFTLEVLILACIVVFVPVSDSDPGGHDGRLGLREVSTAECLQEQ